MGLPRIAAYDLPTEASLPSPRAPWRIDRGRVVLLIHDLQNYFLDAYEEGVPLVGHMLRNTARLKAVCVAHGVPVVYTAQPIEQSSRQRGLLTSMWGPGICAKPERHEVPGLIAPSLTDTVLVKWRYSAFAKTELREWLKEKGRDQLMICGVYAHIGCQVTACEAFMNDIEPFFVADASADFSEEHHRGAIEYISDCCGVTVSTAQALDALMPEDKQSQLPSASRMSSGYVTLAWLEAQLIELLGDAAEEVSLADNLIDLGLDSVRLMSLVERIRGEGVVADFVDLAGEPTLAAWSQLLCNAPVPPAVETILA